MAKPCDIRGERADNISSLRCETAAGRKTFELDQ